jgi:hypothetical protein
MWQGVQTVEDRLAAPAVGKSLDRRLQNVEVLMNIGLLSLQDLHGSRESRVVLETVESLLQITERVMLHFGCQGDKGLRLLFGMLRLLVRP